MPSDLERILLRSVEKKPESRYASARELQADLAACRSRLAVSEVGLKSVLRRPSAVFGGLILLLLVVGASAWALMRNARARSARETMLPEIGRLIEKQRYVDAFLLARQAERYLPDDPQVHRFLSISSVPGITIQTNPPGAEVYFKDYMAPGEDWIHLGQAPLEAIRIHWIVSQAGLF